MSSRRERRGRVAGNVVVAVALTVAAWRVIGIPDGDAVRRFWSGRRPGSAAALATAAVMVWAVVLAVGAWLVAGAARGLTDAAARRAELHRGIAVLVIGTIMLGVGMVRHHRPAIDVCCGNAAAAGANLGR